MKITVFVKFVPDVENYEYDYERNTLVRSRSVLILNPDDQKALGFALQMKKADPSAFVEVVTMGPLSLADQMYDLIRRGADAGVLISDPLFAGSDTLATAGVLTAWIQKETTAPDLILCGSETLDGGTAHIPAQLAELLDIPFVPGIRQAETGDLPDKLTVTLDWQDKILTAEVLLPALLSVDRDAKFRLPFVRRFNIGKDVTNQLTIVTNRELQMQPALVGLAGSGTRVAAVWAMTELPAAEGHTEYTDIDEAVDAVYAFLEEKGVIGNHQNMDRDG